MKIAVAQIGPVKGDITANIEKHVKLITLAAKSGASAIFFPELSLTGYEPALAKELATDQSDNRLEVFREISNTGKITIGVGVPTSSQTGIRISMLIFQPNQTVITYSKQQLHADEFPYFEAGDQQIILTIDNHKIAPAICYESLQANHADNAHKLGAAIYLASVAKPQQGIDKAMTHYPEIAKKFAMPALMSNCVGYCDNFESAGQSAAWTKQGKLAGQLDDKSEGILIFDTETEEVLEQIV